MALDVMGADEDIGFICNICKSTLVGRYASRGDGKRVLFCANCEMGVIENPPEDTDFFYADGYYGGEQQGEVGYADYGLTAEHTLLWVRLLVEALLPSPATILDVGCADGFLLDHLPERFTKLGIEVNSDAIATATRKGIEVIGTDVLSSELSPATVSPLDCITSIATFEHVLDFRLAFTKCIDLLKPTGFLLFEVPLISETEDNSGWMNASYEHIYYPTVQGMQQLLSQTDGLFWNGFEIKIRGFSSSYFAFVTRDKEVFGRASSVIAAMTASSPLGLSTADQALNVAYNLIHRFDPTSERILAFPDLLKVVGYNERLGRIACNMWHPDHVQASSAKWEREQARNWEDAFSQMKIAYDSLRRRTANIERAHYYTVGMAKKLASALRFRSS